MYAIEDLRHLHPSRNRFAEQEGLGIGLALVKQLVELHGGTITLYSAGLNAGSSFKVRLPISR